MLTAHLIHHVVEGRHHIEDSQTGVAHTEDAVEPGEKRKYQLKYDLILGLLGSHEGEAGLVCGLSEGLVSGTQSSEAAGVGGEEARHAAGPVVDL